MSAKSKKTPRQIQDEERKKAMFGEHFLEDIHDQRIDRHNFTIYLSGDPKANTDEDNSEPGVEFNMADRFSRNLNILSGIDAERPILVEMSTCGGYDQEGWAIFDSLLMCPNPVTILARKWPRSMSSIIALAADRFLMTPTSQYMYHDGTFAFEGLSQQAETDFIELLKGKEMMYRVYVARLKSQGMFKDLPEDRIREMLDERKRREIDVWLSAYEAKRWGFADDIFEGNHGTLRAKKKNVERRNSMLAVYRKPVKVKITIS